MNIIHAIFLGVVEGITEFLPISSTAHMILVEKFLNLTSTEFLKTFTISIQLGAILAVVVVYWKKIFFDLKLWKKLCLAFLPTGIIGLLMYKIIKNYLLGNILIIFWAIVLGGLLLIFFELLNLRQEKNKIQKTEKINYWQAFLIGIFQSFAMIPGVSRSAATIIGGLAMGISRKTIVEFSFFLAIPTMLAATGYDLLKHGATFNQTEIEIWLIGFLISFFVAVLAIKFLIRFIQKHTLIAFGIYRLILGFIIFTLFLQ